jgi:thioredoxin reductase (NADPH)
LPEIHDVLIIGSGPAGNMAAIYALRNGLETLILTGPAIGGQLTTTAEVENFPAFPQPISGADLATRLIEQSKNMGARILYDTVSSIDFSSNPLLCRTTEGKTHSSRNIVIATGATPKTLGIPGEEKFRGFGVSSCAVCDGNFFRNQPVAIVGGGETAGIEALHMAKLASRVYLLYRRDRLARMADVTRRRLETNSKIEILLSSEVTEICGTENPKSIEFIQILDNRTNQTGSLKVRAVFLAIGMEPRTGPFANSGLAIDARGYIITEKDSARTNIRNVYAVGDVTNKKYKQAVVAAAYGAIAALEIGEDSTP